MTQGAPTKLLFLTLPGKVASKLLVRLTNKREVIAQAISGVSTFSMEPAVKPDMYELYVTAETEASANRSAGYALAVYDQWRLDGLVSEGRRMDQ